jgi:hypothetical protein
MSKIEKLVRVLLIATVLAVVATVTAPAYASCYLDCVDDCYADWNAWVDWCAAIYAGGEFQECVAEAHTWLQQTCLPECSGPNCQ